MRRPYLIAAAIWAALGIFAAVMASLNDHWWGTLIWCIVGAADMILAHENYQTHKIVRYWK